jgi:acyl-CoA synthetase (AMP-forming)/AMP-acid ligase II
VSSLGALEKHTPKYLRTVAFGSEVFPRAQYDLWRAALPNARFFNLYGPPEATGMSCYWEAKRELSPDEPIPVGRPFDNTDIILLDSENKRAADGEQGEICIRGTCVTMGYYNNPERTDEAFTLNPLTSAYREIIYRTGDIGRMNERGEPVFVCRKDNQIKHMGHRIELGEIESAAMKQDGVVRAVCLYNKDKKEICLFYVGGGDEMSLRAALVQMLPTYMIPAFLRRLDAFPLTDNGKINRTELISITNLPRGK